MRRLTRTESILMLVGSCLMVIGAGLFVFGLHSVAPIIFAPGTLLFALMQIRQSYEGDDLTLRRLVRIMHTGSLFFVLAALLMIASAYPQQAYQLLQKMGMDYTTYLVYVHNNWVVALLAAAIIQLYTTHRISHEIGKKKLK